MKKILLIKFRTTGRIYCYPHPATKEKFKAGENVLIETEQGLETGTILQIKQGKPDQDLLGKIIRKQKEEDAKKLKELEPEVQEAIEFCQEQIKHLGLPMKVLDAEISLDEKKLTFYFVAEDRVDFRDLLPLLINHFHKNIRLQQIGPRDAASILGGFGSCGRNLCCKTFLKNIESISVDLAKDQDLASVGTSKITGLCGKLMCCLVYEHETYQKLRENLPAIGKKIKTGKGMGEIIAQNVLKQSVLVRLKDGSREEHKIFIDKDEDSEK